MKFKMIHYSLGLSEVSQVSERLILALLRSIFDSDKKLWIEAVKEYCE
jgi:hypothetical protein